MFEIFVRFGGCLCHLLPLFVNRQPPCPHINSRNVLLHPLMHNRNLWCRKGRSGGVKWAQVSRDEPGRKGKKPPLNGSQQPACSHQEHQILSTAEATAFATQFWDCKEPSKAIKMKFEKFLQVLPQAENRFSDATRPSTEMVHLAPVGGRRASPYNVWIHWLQKEEADQFKKRGKADFKPQISLNRPSGRCKQPNWDTKCDEGYMRGV